MFNAALVPLAIGCGGSVSRSVSPVRSDAVPEPDADTPVAGRPMGGLSSADDSSTAIETEVPDETPRSTNDTDSPPPVDTDMPRFHVPWTPGEAHRVSQGNLGTFSHRNLYAWDFPMPEGTPVLASAAGIVVGLRESSENGANLGVSTEPENFVALDHGSGLKSVYSHLIHDGVSVSIGDRVAQGQVIGLSGNTGFSTAPHLHYEIRDTTNRSVPSGFIESDRLNGVAVLGDELTSRNEWVPGSADGLVPSTMAAGAFSINAVEIQNNVLPGFLFTTDVDYEIRGRVLTDDSRVCAALVDPDSFATVLCDLQRVDADGSFSIPLRFASDKTGPYWFGIISGDGGANGLAPARIYIAAGSEDSD